MVDVSVIILNYNTFDLTCECIASIYEFTEGVSFEILVVDNASTECSPELFKRAFPEIILIASKTNLGFAGGNNLGIQHATDRTILLLNSDTRLLNNAIFLAYSRLLQSDKVAAVTGKLVYPTGEVQLVAQQFPSVKLLMLEILRLYHLIPREKRGKVFASNYFDYKTELEPDWIWATFFFIRREVIERLPQQKLPEDFFMYEEDKLWCYRIRQLGYRVLYSPEPLILHHMSGSNKAFADILTNNRHILINELKFISMTKSRLYARTYFILKAIHYLTSSYRLARPLAKL
ncbi:glycosyltransferase family 2 protein [Pontibacter ruber]|uniref:Glycosyltransferase family 2 protein n=2 Tax=Pontibacter ruber TaxID=1343895 RepID=A0ABW5CVP2_9BACT